MCTHTEIDRDRAVAAMRRFDRFYTRRLGALEERQHGEPFSLTETRILYELATRIGVDAATLGRELGLDAGDLSRILARLQTAGLVAHRCSAQDERRSEFAVTAAGQAAFRLLDARSEDRVGALLGSLDAAALGALTGALARVETLLGDAPPAVPTLRPHGPGDLGWVVGRHGALYAQEYGWDLTFEALVAEIAAGFLRAFDPDRERAFVAERDGERLGFVCLVRADDETAKLRLLLVEPHARGLGLGARLVDACTDFARASGYRRIVLWTNDCLTAALALYERAGYRLTASEPHRSFGKDLVGETWELAL